MEDFYLLPIFAVSPKSKQCILVPRPYFVILPCVNNLVKFHSQQMFVCVKWIKSSVSYSSGSGSDKIKELHLIGDLLMPPVTVEGDQLHCSAGKGWCHQTWWTWAWFQNSQSKRREAIPANCPPLIFIYLLRKVCTSHTCMHACTHVYTHRDALNKEMNEWTNVKKNCSFDGGEKASQHRRERAQERWGADSELSRP